MDTIEVFLVEDNPADVLLVRVALSQFPFPLRLLVAKDGEQALKMLSSSDFQPQLIILDLNMPRVDGQTVLQHYQQKKIPVVIFSSTQNKAEVQKALALAPKDPRVRLLAAQMGYAGAKTTQERAQQVAPFQSAVDAFELERQGMERLPSWGAAEAWQGLAQVYLDRGDAIAARSALEHALLLMPDYKSAHRLLDHILKG